MNSFIPLLQRLFCYIFLPFVAILFIYSQIEEYRYKKYWNTKWDTKLYESLIWSKFLKDKPKKDTKKNKTTDKILNVYKVILYAWVWILILATIIAIIYSIIK